jgi:hypothetical protein
LGIVTVGHKDKQMGYPFRVEDLVKNQQLVIQHGVLFEQHQWTSRGSVELPLVEQAISTSSE